MNLLGKRKTGLLAMPMALLLLVLLGCKDELKTIELDKDLGQFDVLYKEFVLAPKLVLHDSVITGNPSFIYVGELDDNEFGSFKRKHYTEYIAATSTVLEETNTYDSAYLYLQYEFTYEGAPEGVLQTMNIYELSDSLNTEDNDFTIQNSIPYNPAAIGTLEYTPDIENFETLNAGDSVRVLKIKLEDGFGQRLFNAAQNEDYFTNPVPGLRRQEFPGILIDNSGPNMLGFKRSIETKLVVYSTTNDDEPVSNAYNFSLFTSFAFEGVEVDRSGTALTHLTDFYTPVDPVDGNAYVQGTTGIHSLLSLQEIVDTFKDEESFKLNSALIEFDGIEDAENFEIVNSPFLLNMVLCEENGQYRYRKRKRVISTDGDVAFDKLSKDFIYSDESTFKVNLYTYEEYQDKTRRYRGNITFFLQSLLDGEVATTNFVTTSSTSQEADAIYQRANFQRFKVDANNIKIKIFYTQAKKD